MDWYPHSSLKMGVDQAARRQSLDEHAAEAGLFGKPGALAPRIQNMVRPIVLIVDDDMILLESMADLLLLSDFQVLTASNGAEALQVLHQKRPDCIISDVMMPEMDGYTLLEAVRSHQEWSAIPVILITAYDRRFAKRTAQQFAPNAVLAKPFDVDQLINVIQNSLP